MRIKGRKLENLTFLASLGLYGYYIYSGFKTPLPGQDQNVAEGLEVECRIIETQDGAKVAVKRYVKEGATPVVFFHGMTGNGFEFDLPRERHNMAVYFARRGYDVWITSFRGCGREPYRGDAGDWKHSMDELAIYDASAVIDEIIETTKKKPFWIGHSLGGMVLYIYLEGAKFDESGKVVIDRELAKERNEKLLGAIPIASPTAFLYRRSHPFYIPTRSVLGQAIMGAAILYFRVRDSLGGHAEIGSVVQKHLIDHPRFIMAMSRSPIGIVLYRRANTDSDTTTSLIKWGADDLPFRMDIQLLDGIRSGHLRQYFSFSFRDFPCDYTINMPLIEAPILFISGEKDFAGWSTIKKYGYEVVSSKKKDMLVFPDYGHTDLVIGKNVEDEVYPAILQWMRKIESEES